MFRTLTVVVKGKEEVKNYLKFVDIINGRLSSFLSWWSFSFFLIALK